MAVFPNCPLGENGIVCRLVDTMENLFAKKMAAINSHGPPISWMTCYKLLPQSCLATALVEARSKEARTLGLACEESIEGPSFMLAVMEFCEQSIEAHVRGVHPKKQVQRHKHPEGLS